MKRGSYAGDLRAKVRYAKLAVLAYATRGGCMMAGNLAEMSRIPMDHAMQAAEE
jgi:hypothetical protein